MWTTNTINRKALEMEMEMIKKKLKRYFYPSVKVQTAEIQPNVLVLCFSLHTLFKSDLDLRSRCSVTSDWGRGHRGAEGLDLHFEYEELQVSDSSRAPTQPHTPSATHINMHTHIHTAVRRSSNSNTVTDFYQLRSNCDQNLFLLPLPYCLTPQSPDRPGLGDNGDYECQTGLKP